MAAKETLVMMTLKEAAKALMKVTTTDKASYDTDSLRCCGMKL